METQKDSRRYFPRTRQASPLVGWGRVYLFSQLLAKMVGEPAPTIIFQVQFLDLFVQNSLYYSLGL